MENLQDIRNRINELDEQIVKLFCERMECSQAVGNYKKAHNVAIFNADREAEILNRVEREGGQFGYSARLMYANIMELSRAIQHNIVGSGKELRSQIAQAPAISVNPNVKIACQGIKGANSHEAALRLFGHKKILFYQSFSAVFEAIESGEADYGVVPVENSNAGSVFEAYDLILKHRLYIIDAIDLKINHCLCGLKQSCLEDIEYVWSHPQAISQCSKFIADNNMNAVTYSNTAVAAREVFAEKRLNCAAICTEAAAEEYGLKVIKKNIQNTSGNTTRFIVISKRLSIPENAQKISLCFSVPHSTGSLYTLLCRFSSLGLNLTKIESRPTGNKSFDYMFYLDFTGNARDEKVTNLLCALSEELPEFSFLGNYEEKF